MERTHEQNIVERLRRLEPQQIEEVVDFIEFLAEKRGKRPPIVQLLGEIQRPRIGIVEIRRRLGKIQGKMSDTVRELRDERG